MGRGGALGAGGAFKGGFEEWMDFEQVSIPSLPIEDVEKSGAWALRSLDFLCEQWGASDDF